MKLIAFAGLLVACSAASLEHLEKQHSDSLKIAKTSSSSSEDSSIEASLGVDTNAIGISSAGHASAPSHSDKELSSSITDPEFSGYLYGPGIQNTYNQQSNRQDLSQYGKPSPNQQFGLQGTDKYSRQQTRNQLYSPQGPRQQFGQQLISQQYSQQAQNQQFRQQPVRQQYAQQAENQEVTSQYTQQGQNQQFGQQPISQQYPQNLEFGHHVGSQFSHQDALPQGSNNFGAQARYQPRPSVANNQNFASQSSQNYPQQSFDEETGYHY